MQIEMAGTISIAVSAYVAPDGGWEEHCIVFNFIGELRRSASRIVDISKRACGCDPGTGATGKLSFFHHSSGDEGSGSSQFARTDIPIYPSLHRSVSAGTDNYLSLSFRTGIRETIECQNGKSLRKCSGSTPD